MYYTSITLWALLGRARPPTNKASFHIGCMRRNEMHIDWHSSSSWRLTISPSISVYAMPSSQIMLVTYKVTSHAHFREIAYNATVEDRFMPQKVHVSLTVLSQCLSTILMLKLDGTIHRIPTRSVMEDGVPLAIHQHLALSHQSKTDPLLCSPSSSISTPTHWTARLLVQTRCNILRSKRR